jgi:hypothetical protein
LQDGFACVLEMYVTDASGVILCKSEWVTAADDAVGRVE